MKTEFKNKIFSHISTLNKISIISLVEDLILFAYFSNASDIHIDPLADCIRVRLRIDGLLEDFFSLPKNIHQEIITRIKILCSLRTDEHQSPQDGRFKNKINNQEQIDLRVSIIPTYFGENCVIRLLVNKNEDLNIDQLNFSEKDCEFLKKSVKKNSGVILITGPTGSGKTTTLYSLIKYINKPHLSIITIEDPIEYSIRGIRQIQTNHQANINFLNGLRSILRQDPDIIMLGEIRDSETAKTAINIGLTGHLLLSTLHTNSAAATLPRLIDMGIDPYLIASTINLIVNQKLLRKICIECKNISEEKNINENCSLKEVQDFFSTNKSTYIGTGCKSCNFTGYKGRISVYEILQISPAIKQAIFKKYPAQEIQNIACKENMKTILEDSLNKAGLGLTTISEILRTQYE